RAGLRGAGQGRDGALLAVRGAGEREREHRAEAESGGEDPVLVDAELSAEAIHHRVSESDVLAARVPPPEAAAREGLTLGRDQDRPAVADARKPEVAHLLSLHRRPAPRVPA